MDVVPHSPGRHEYCAVRTTRPRSGCLKRTPFLSSAGTWRHDQDARSRIRLVPGISISAIVGRILRSNGRPPSVSGERPRRVLGALPAETFVDLVNEALNLFVPRRSTQGDGRGTQHGVRDGGALQR